METCILYESHMGAWEGQGEGPCREMGEDRRATHDEGVSPRLQSLATGAGSPCSLRWGWGMWELPSLSVGGNLELGTGQAP